MIMVFICFHVLGEIVAAGILIFFKIRKRLMTKLKMFSRDTYLETSFLHVVGS